MRKNRTEIRLVKLTLMSAVLIIIMAYLWTNQGFIRSQLAIPKSDGAQAVIPSQAMTPAEEEASAQAEMSTQGKPSTLGETSAQAAPSAQPAISTQMQTQSQTQEPAGGVLKPLNTTIVAVGDSFTYGNPFGPENSWTKWAATNLGVTVINHARVGQTSKDVLAHFDEDVLAEKPGRVVIFVGNGDAIKGISNEDYQSAVKLMAEKARAHQIIPILALPVPYRGFEQRIDMMREGLKAYAAAEKIRTLDLATVLFNSQGKFLKGMSQDGKYPTLQGYQVMGKYAAEVLTDL